MIIGNDLLFGLSGFLPFLFHRISYRYIKQQPFIGRNTNEFLNLLFIEPSQNTRSQPLTLGSKRDVSSSNTDIY